VSSSRTTTSIARTARSLNALRSHLSRYHDESVLPIRRDYEEQTSWAVSFTSTDSSHKQAGWDSRHLHLPKRWIVERTWAWLMNSRRLQVDYERDPVVTEGFIWAAHSRYLLRRLTQSPTT
jgi:transposase